jgi:hypothetical protein
MLSAAAGPVNVRERIVALSGGLFWRATCAPGAYARVATPEMAERANAAGREFSTVVEKAVENQGFLITQA